MLPGFFADIMGKFSSGPEQPRELDKTKAKLKELSETITPQTVGEVWGKIRPSFDADMEELGVTDQAKKEELWLKVKQQVESTLLENSEELCNVDAFISNAENLPELKKIIESTDPKAKADQWLKSLSEKIPGWGLISGGIAGYLMSWADESKKDNKDSFLGAQLRKLASWLGGGKEKNEGAREASAEEVAKGLIEKFKTPLKMDEKNGVADVEWLKKAGVKTEEIAPLADQALGQNGKLARIMASLNGFKPLTETTISTRLKYIYLQKFDDTKIEQLEGILLANEKGAGYERPKDMAGANQLLEASLSTSDLKVALEKFKKKPDVALTATATASTAPTLNAETLNTNEGSFQIDVLNVKNLPVLVDFWAPWCGPCKTQGPILDELANEMKGKVRICKVNIDENATLAKQYGVEGIPSLKVFKNGKIMEGMVGVHTKSELLDVIKKNA